MFYLETRVNTPFDEQKVCKVLKDLVKLLHTICIPTTHS
jgi:hypothetical protein